MSGMKEELVRTIDRLLADTCGKETRSAAESGTWPLAVWRGLEDLGATRAAVPESAGGVGLEFTDAMELVRRAAYHAAPVPLAETMAASRLLAAAGIDVPEGALTLAPTFDGSAKAVFSPEQKLTGVLEAVPWGEDCGYVVLAADNGGQETLLLVRTDQAERSTTRNLANEPRVRLAFDGIRVDAAAPLPGARERLLAEGALARSVQMAGALDRILALSLQYANDRVQFGRPIGKFQAVQHMLAQLAGHVAAASAAADAAVAASAQAPNPIMVAIAKSRSGEAAGRGAEIAHQVHAAMGFTREHDLHYSTRRLWSWRDEFGGETLWQKQLGRQVAAQGADALWPMLTQL